MMRLRYRMSKKACRSLEKKRSRRSYCKFKSMESSLGLNCRSLIKFSHRKISIRFKSTKEVLEAETEAIIKSLIFSSIEQFLEL